MTGSFGAKQFVVSEKNIVTPGGISFSESLKYEEQERLGDKPAIYVKAPGALTISFSLTLLAPYADVQGEIVFWLVKLRAKQPELLTLGNRAWGTGKALLTSVGVADLGIRADGSYHKAVLSLSFIEYAAAGTDEDGGAAPEGPAIKAARIMLAEGV